MCHATLTTALNKRKSRSDASAKAQWLFLKHLHKELRKLLGMFVLFWWSSFERDFLWVTTLKALSLHTTIIFSFFVDLFESSKLAFTSRFEYNSFSVFGLFESSHCSSKRKNHVLHVAFDERGIFVGFKITTPMKKWQNKLSASSTHGDK